MLYINLIAMIMGSYGILMAPTASSISLGASWYINQVATVNIVIILTIKSAL